MFVEQYNEMATWIKSPSFRSTYILACPPDTPIRITYREFDLLLPEEGVMRSSDGTMWKRGVEIRRVSMK